MATLPPGPRAPAAWQTVEWVARPTALLRRCAARHGDVFTLRTLWADAPMVCLSDPTAIRTVFAAPPDVVRAGQSATFLEPFAGPSSILLLDGERHLRQRRLMLPPFHGDRLHAHRATVAALTGEEVARWPLDGRPVRLHERLQRLTLEVIARAVFGAREGPELHALRAAIARALDLTRRTPALVAMSLVQRDLGPRSPWGAFHRAVRDVDALLYDLIAQRRERGGGGAILDDLLAARDEHGDPPTDGELRDQLVTLLAAGHETTAGALAWAFERLAHHPGDAQRIRDGDDAHLAATVKEVLRTRPVLSIAPRKLVAPLHVAGHDLPAGVHVAPCIYLAHRRADVAGPDPLAFRPARWLGPDPPTGTLPFGGGVRRCLGAAFATMELEEVLRTALAQVRLGPERPGRGERMRRRSVTLTPERGGRVVLLSPGRDR